MTPLIRLVSLATLPIALLISMSHLIGAENGPGDGFTAGIITSLALTLEYVAFGYKEARSRIQWIRFEYVLFLGIFVALLASVIPLLGGEPLLARQEFALELPLVGTLRLTRALLFDFGIYLVVVGGTMTIFDSLARVAE